MTMLEGGSKSMVAAALRQAFIQPNRTQASATLRHFANQLREKWPKLAAFIDSSEVDVLSYLDFPEQHCSKLPSTDEIDKPQPGKNSPVLPFGCCRNLADCHAPHSYPANWPDKPSRRTAPLPDARPGRRGQSPKPRSGAPLAQGLTALIPGSGPFQGAVRRQFQGERRTRTARSNSCYTTLNALDLAEVRRKYGISQPTFYVSKRRSSVA
jgi:hypothetical protein